MQSIAIHPLSVVDTALEKNRKSWDVAYKNGVYYANLKSDECYNKYNKYNECYKIITLWKSTINKAEMHMIIKNEEYVVCSM